MYFFALKKDLTETLTRPSQVFYLNLILLKDLRISSKPTILATKPIHHMIPKVSLKNNWKNANVTITPSQNSAHLYHSIFIIP